MQDVPFVRIHSSCVFSESFGSTDCDCALQLDASLHQITQSGGFVIYMWDEGRGCGIGHKVRAIHLQQTRGLNTVQAYEELGAVADPRTYQLAIHAMREARIGPAIKLATSNPKKVQLLTEAGFDVRERVRLDLNVDLDKNQNLRSYLSDKREFLGHHEDS